MRASFRTHEKTIEEWKQCFTSDIHEADETQVPDSSATRYLFPDPDKFALKTPKKNTFFDLDRPSVTIPPELLEIANQDQDLVPSQYWWDEEESASLLPNSMYSFLCNLRLFLIKYDQWLVEPLDVLTLRFDTVESDLHKLKQLCDTLQLSIGRPLSLQDNDFPDLWSAVEFLSGTEKPAVEKPEMTKMLQQVQQVLDQVNQTQTTFIGLSKTSGRS